MDEGRRKLNLTMKVTDTVVKLANIVNDFSEDRPSDTVIRFSKWIEETNNFIDNEFNKEEAERFKAIEKTYGSRISAADVDRFSREHANYLQELIQEMVDKK